MFAKDQYQLIDFGEGKKLELFAGVQVLRNCPAAENIVPECPKRIRNKRLLSHSKQSMSWLNAEPEVEDWSLKHGTIKFGLKLTPFGHLGVFPEQACNWSWIQSLPFELDGLNALNLFAYTGGTSMALAAKGATVTHVDSAKNIVRWASSNAEQSGMNESPIRWIVEDAVKFVEREIRRGKQYDVIVADPPAVGHAGQKLTWKIERDLEKLVGLLSELATNEVKLILLSCHSMGFDATDLKKLVNQNFSAIGDSNVESGKMDLTSNDGRKLNCGYFLRWHC